MNVRKPRINPSRSAAKLHALLLDALRVSENLQVDATKYDAEIKRLNLRVRSLEHTTIVERMHDLEATHERRCREYEAEIKRLNALLEFTKESVLPFLDDYQRLRATIAATDQGASHNGAGAHMPEGDLVREDPSS